MHTIYCIHMLLQPCLTFSPMKVMHSHQPPTCFPEPLPSPRCSRGSVEAFRLPWRHCLYRCQLSWLEGSIENMGLQGWNICMGFLSMLETWMFFLLMASVLSKVFFVYQSPVGWIGVPELKCPPWTCSHGDGVLCNRRKRLENAHKWLFCNFVTLYIMTWKYAELLLLVIFQTPLEKIGFHQGLRSHWNHLHAGNQAAVTMSRQVREMGQQGRRPEPKGTVRAVFLLICIVFLKIVKYSDIIVVEVLKRDVSNFLEESSYNDVRCLID